MRSTMRGSLAEHFEQVIDLHQNSQLFNGLVRIHLYYNVENIQPHHKERTMSLLTEHNLAIPPIDAVAPRSLETATFALG